MKNSLLNLLFASLCALSFSAGADDTKGIEKAAAVAKDAVEKTVEKAESAEAKADKKPATAEGSAKKEEGEEEPECD